MARRRNAASGIREPKDLIGKKVGNPEYQMTAPVWIRGILQDEYGVPVDTQTYYTGGEEEPNRDEKLKLDLPPQYARSRYDLWPGAAIARPKETA